MGPQSLEDVVPFLDERLTDDDKQRIQGYDADQYVGATHMGIGMWLRARLGLWSDCPVTRYFNARGVAHADNMSGAIIDAYWIHLHGRTYDAKSIIACYADWEKEAERLKAEAAARDENAIPFPSFVCPDRKPAPWLTGEENTRVNGRGHR